MCRVHGYEACAVRNFSGDASCGARYVMAQRARMGGNCAPEKLRAAEDQQTHLYTQRQWLIEQNIRSNAAGGSCGLCDDPFEQGVLRV